MNSRAKEQSQLATLHWNPFPCGKTLSLGSHELCECIQPGSTGVKGAVISRRGWDSLSRDELPYRYPGVPSSDCDIQAVPMSLCFFSTESGFSGLPVKTNRVDRAVLLLL